VVVLKFGNGVKYTVRVDSYNFIVETWRVNKDENSKNFNKEMVISTSYFSTVKGISDHILGSNIKIGIGNGEENILEMVEEAINGLTITSEASEVEVTEEDVNNATKYLKEALERIELDVSEDYTKELATNILNKKGLKDA